MKKDEETTPFYSACWTDSGCLLSCWHSHLTIQEATECINYAGGYVVAIEDGVLRALTPVEEAEFHRAIDASRAIRPMVDEGRDARVGESDVPPHYAVMIWIKVVDVWTWSTWQVYDTYEQAESYAREGDRVVPFRSGEWAALRQHSEPALPSAATATRNVRLHWRKGETLVEFVARSLDHYGFDQPSASFGPAGFQRRADSSSVGLMILIDLVDLVLNWIDSWEVSELERLHAKQVPAWLETLRERARLALDAKSFQK
jgi:hypothetical protein